MVATVDILSNRCPLISGIMAITPEKGVEFLNQNSYLLQGHQKTTFMKRHGFIRFNRIIALASFIMASALPAPGDGPVDAGSGEPKPYIIRPDSSAEPFDDKTTYFSITAVSWRVNAQGNWLKSKQASGSVTIICNGSTFNFPLGSYDLTKGQRTAGIFGAPLLPTTPWDGSAITLQGFLTGMKQNTLLGNILQELATDALNYGSTAAGTLALSSAYPGLSQLSRSANNISSSLVQKMAEKTVPIFDPKTGISIGLGKDDLKGDLFYVLLYKGRILKDSELTIGPDKLSVLENLNPLSDGAWILLQVTKESLYAGARPWTEPSRHAIRELTVEMTRYQRDPSLGAGLKKGLETTPQGAGKSLGDQFVFVYNLIDADKALTFSQAEHEELNFIAYLDFARLALQNSNPKLFFDGVEGLEGKNPAAISAITSIVATHVPGGADPNKLTAEIVALPIQKASIARAQAALLKKAKERRQQTPWSSPTMRRGDSFTPMNDH